MSKEWSCHKKLITRGLYSISFLVISALYIVINHYTGRERHLVTFIDNLIPFNKYFIFVYIFWYAYISIFLIYFCINDEKKYYKILIGLNAGMLISYSVYLVFPTTILRPVLNLDNGLIDSLFRWLYNKDNPYNCFPSIHVMNTLIIAIYVNKDNLYLNKYIKVASSIIAAAIIYSTLTIKQHVLLDVVGAAVLAYGLYMILDYKELSEKIRSLQRVSET